MADCICLWPLVGLNELSTRRIHYEKSALSLISGCVYMLLAAKLQKFGGISVMGIVADFVAKTGNYKSKKGLLASYVLFSFGLFGPVFPMWFMKEAYVANLESRGKDGWIEAGLAGLVLYTP